MNKPTLTYDTILTQQTAAWEMRHAMATHPISRLIVKSIESGELPIPLGWGVEPEDKLSGDPHGRSIQVDKLSVHRDAPDTFAAEVEIPMFIKHEDCNRVCTVQYHGIPLSLLCDKPSLKIFFTWCKTQRERYAKDMIERAIEAKKQANEALRAVKKPVSRGHGDSWSY